MMTVTGTAGAGDILQQFLDGRARTKAEIAQSTGLSRSTVATRIDALLASVAGSDVLGEARAALERRDFARALDLPLAYPVHVGRGLFPHVGAIASAAAPAHRFAVISDTTVASLHGSAALSSLQAYSARWLSWSQACSGPTAA